MIQKLYGIKIESIFGTEIPHLGEIRNKIQAMSSNSGQFQPINFEKAL